MDKVKEIIFKVKLKGNGVVNFGDKEDKKNYKRSNLNSKFGSRHDNVNYANKNLYKNGSIFIKDKDGNDIELDDLSYKLVISSNSLRHDIFKMDAMNQSPNITHNEAILYSYIASPANILRGYMFTSKGAETIKRTTPITIVAAEQTCNAVSTIKISSRSGMKNIDPDKKDNTLYYKESVGAIEYATHGSIDLMGLQFVSCDVLFNRYSYNPDYFELYKTFLKSRIDNFDSELGYYMQKKSIIDIPEFGFKFSNENVVQLVKEFFQRLIRVNILRSGAYAKVVSVDYKLVYDAIEDTLEDEDNWVTIKSDSDINDIDFEFEEYYLKEEEDSERIEMAKKEKEAFIILKAEIKKKKEEKKAKEKAEKKKADEAAKLAANATLKEKAPKETK